MEEANKLKVFEELKVKIFVEQRISTNLESPCIFFKVSVLIFTGRA